jgi:hypothetical protein
MLFFISSSRVAGATIYVVHRSSPLYSAPNTRRAKSCAIRECPEAQTNNCGLVLSRGTRLSSVRVLVELLPSDTGLSVRPSRDRRMRSQVPPTIICGMPWRKHQARLRGGDTERAGTTSKNGVQRSLALTWPFLTTYKLPLVSFHLLPKVPFSTGHSWTRLPGSTRAHATLVIHHVHLSTGSVTNATKATRPEMVMSRTASPDCSVNQVHRWSPLA